MAYTYEYPRPSVGADMVAVSVNPVSGVLKLLLIERGKPPYAGHWALPGGFMDMEETPEQAAVRELQEETGLRVGVVEQVGAFGAVDRDPRGRILTIAYFGVVQEANAQVQANDDAAQARWFTLDSLPPLAFDHNEVLEQAWRFARMRLAWQKNQATSWLGLPADVIARLDEGLP